MNEKRYDKKVLNLLLDKYERSAVYRGTAKRNQSISLTINKKQFPEYFDLTSMAFEIFNEQMESLDSENLVDLIWKGQKEDGILKRVVLNLDPDCLAQSYAFAERRPKQEKEERIREVLKEYWDEFPAFVSWAEERLQKHESVKQYIDLDDPKELQKVLYLAKKIRENKSDIFLRRFSILTFHDSKIAEHEIGSAVAILTHFPENDQKVQDGQAALGQVTDRIEIDDKKDSDNDEQKQNPGQNLTDFTTDEVLEEYNIYRNPSWVMVKGCGAPLHLSMGVGISNEDIDQIPWDMDSAPERIVTIENLTSFHQWNIEQDGRDLVIYLGGYANRARRNMLKNLHVIYPDAVFSHFGDVDAGGFRIWKNLCLSTGLEISTLHMDEETYLQYLEYGKELTEHDRRALKRMSEDPFFRQQKHLFQLMLAKNRKLEQECIV